jgi:hypothetical protein
MLVLLRFLILCTLKVVAHLFYACEAKMVGEPIPEPWRGVRIVVLLHHTSLYEFLYIYALPLSFLWQLARHATVPAAEETIRRPFVGRLMKAIMPGMIPITRKRDESWDRFLDSLSPEATVVILPEGRMMRRSGLDKHGQPMTVRGGIADILRRLGEGRMLIGYSGGLHHVHAPGDRSPQLFRRLKLNLEVLDIDSYKKQFPVPDDDLEGFRAAVREDLQRRRDQNRPAL